MTRMYANILLRYELARNSAQQRLIMIGHGIVSSFIIMETTRSHDKT